MAEAKLPCGHRADATLFGVCHAIGECCGVPPLLPRLAFVAAVLADQAAVALLAYGIAVVMLVVVRQTS